VLQEIFENLNVDAAPQIGRAGFPDALAEFEKNKRDSAARKGPK
jgi:hypothetical protein